ncbi:ribonuclease H2 subunit C isoform X2 [Carcharodon carcharias]|uniref:ribonuclease H2 subunit C isoform X2 n=1 Tax=Carcharodon carcharias TaxID=13397 RepID=UPI001B7DAE45|nr:ribonuclease H2 subunit C isoform X2 [Carcharodon carcharias]
MDSTCCRQRSNRMEMPTCINISQQPFKRERGVSFRGRALRGRDLPVPLGYVGLVLKEDHEPCLEEEDRRLRVKSAFSSMTYWNLETPPTADDSVVMVMSWTQLAEAIHGPVEDQ